MNVQSISADSRYVAFLSQANNLVTGDTNGHVDVFVHDRLTGETTCVSVGPNGEQANAGSFSASISADGRYVAFASEATNLLENRTNGQFNVFVHDRSTGTTSLVSVSSNGTQGNGDSADPDISPDGRFVAFQSLAQNLVVNDTNGQLDVFVHDRMTGETTRVSISTNGVEGNNWSSSPAISADGRYVAFYSFARNLIDGQNIRYQRNAFVHDRSTGTTSLVSVSSNGTNGAGDSFSTDISADGRYVAFYSTASNLVSGDTNGQTDAFVHDRITGETTRVSISTNGTQGTGGSFRPSLSADGRLVAFESIANNLVEHDENKVPDIFVHDRQTGQTSLVSIANDGSQGNKYSYNPSISADGQFVAFSSDATNLVADDTNDRRDIFVYDRAGVVSPTPTPTPTPLPQPTTSYHSGFDPQVDAYQFINDDARVSWDTYVRTYGGDNANTLTGKWDFFATYQGCWYERNLCQGIGQGGVCNGMAATEALVYRGQLDLNAELGISKLKDAVEPTKSPIVPFIGEMFWDSTPVSDFLVVYSGRQFTNEFYAEGSRAKERSLRDTVNLLKLSLQGETTPYYIGLKGTDVPGTNCRGHALMPTAWEGNDEYVAFTVVDPNGNDTDGQAKESKVITVTFGITEDTWIADMSASNWGVWTSKNSCSNSSPALVALSATVLKDARSPYWDVPVSAASVSSNVAHLFVSESVTATVHSDAEFYIPFGPTRGSQGNYPQHYTYDAGKDMRVTLQYSDTNSFVQVIEPGRISAIQGSGAINSQDQVVINGLNDQIAVTAGSDGGRILTSVTDRRQIDVAEINLAANTSVTTTFGSEVVTIKSEVDQPGYTLHVNNAGIMGTVEYTLTMPILEAGSTHHLTPDSTQQLVVIEIDTGSDGVIDDKVVVKQPIDTVPDGERLYLPIVVK
jgi:hypothetical protein